MITITGKVTGVKSHTLSLFVAAITRPKGSYNLDLTGQVSDAICH